MLNDLKFAAGAIARKDFVPALTYFRISEGRIYGFNGVLAISTPTDLAVTCVPKAANFIKAVERVPDDTEIVLNLTQAGKLSIKSGPFRAYVECLADEQAFPNVQPAGEYVELPGGLLPVLRKLAPFMGVDASRPWAMGVLLRGQSAFATNNIVLIEHWLPIVFPTPLTLPSDAVKEMLRIGTEPVAIQLEERAVTFHYPNGAWLRTSTSSTEWPDLSRVLDKPHDAQPFPEGFFEAAARLDAFVTKERRLYMRAGMLATSAHDGEGATMTLDNFWQTGCYYLDQMVKLDGIATSIDFSLYPAPCLFFGDMLRGAIIGMRIHDAV